MTIENLKQIAIKYATTKGSRVPLAPDELCNAVVQYFNEFLKITADINTIQVAVTEEGGNIVFTITGNTLDGKAFTPIVITVDHNDFVTDQEFEEFKTTTNAAIQKNTESINSLSFRVEDTENDITTIQVQVGQINTRVGNTETDVTNLKNRVDNTETNIAEINSTLENKVDVIKNPVSNFVAYVHINQKDENLSFTESAIGNTIVYRRASDGGFNVSKGTSGQNVANMENIADVEAKIPDVSNFATKDDLSEKLDTSGGTISGNLTVSGKINTSAYESRGAEVIDLDISNRRFDVGNTAYGINIFSSNRPTVTIGESISNIALENDITTIQVQVGQINTRVGNTETDVTNLKNRVDNTETNIAEINSTLENKVDVIKNPVSNFVAYVHINQKDENLSFTESAIGNTIVYRRASDGGFNVSKGTSGQNVANMENIADVEAKIPDVSNFATKDDLSEKLDTSGGTISGNLTVSGKINTSAYESRGAEVIDLDISNRRFDVGNTAYGINIFSSNRPTVTIGESISNIALENDIPEYTLVDSVIYDATNGAIIAYNGANEIHIPLLAGENVTIGASEDNKKIVISAAGGGGAGDVTAAGNNTFTGENTFNNSIYAKNGIVAGDTTNYGANSVTKGSNTYSFPNKSGTFAMTNDIINEPIYFISFYANEPSEPCHLIGTIMSKNSYGTGQKTNEEFAVMLADNFYTNSNEGLAAYGRLAEKDILCIYSEDGLSIRCLNEENSEVDLPTVMFFVMETEL